MLWGKRSHQGEERTFFIFLRLNCVLKRIVHLNSCVNDVLSVIETRGKEHVSLCFLNPHLIQFKNYATRLYRKPEEIERPAISSLVP